MNKLSELLWFVDSETGDCQIWSGTTQRLEDCRKAGGLWQEGSLFTKHPCPLSTSQPPLQPPWTLPGTRSQQQDSEQKQCVSNKAASLGVASPWFLSPILEVGSERLQDTRGQIAESALQEI